ncbi:hypothetical protein GOP47_0015432 [Adiantum capillus-veneris]|uniref:AB hydrolase-1 domain-containing protein n=1 Tax=Adiantum capillus-veneris TaxID=13818 RepID=A0A9D4ZDZ4_ADICA|nr:hypothetical protein GOP47_0015432 [Adiantum capillus-veneris]
MCALYNVVPFPAPMQFPCKQLQRAILCSAASGAMSGSPESWQPLVSQPDASEFDRLQARKRLQKRVQIAGVDQAELVDPWLLADPDSRFAELHGVQLHYKIACATDAVDEQSNKDVVLRQRDVLKNDDVMQREDVLLTSSVSECASSSSPESSSLPSSTIPAILLHGFGASLFSWERVMKPLAEVLQSCVIAFDRPAFGLTSRINVPLAPSDFLRARKAVLIGHSAGCIIAADAYLKDPERVAALIMVAPALFAPLATNKKAQTQEQQNVLLKVVSNLWAKFMWLFSRIGAFIQFVLCSIRRLWCHLLTAILRSDFGYWLIRLVMDKLSLQAVRLAWYDKKKIDDYVIAGYTKPLKCRDWERALLEYVIALVGDPSSNEGQLPLSQRLKDIRCPVLVITGDSDAIVPAWNAERLSRVLPNAKCHVIKNCGHLPQEETPEEFLRVIHQFMLQVQHKVSEEKISNETMVFMPA